MPENPAPERAAGQATRESLFFREGARHRFTARTATVTAVREIAGRYVRVTLSGPELADFRSDGPADHVRVFFPDTAGRLYAPKPAGPDVDGIRPADGPTFGRDFTPLAPRQNDTSAHREVDLDILRHEKPGPAAQWATNAKPGDRLGLVGPRGSKRAPQRVGRILLIVDGTALPSASRWLDDAAPHTSVEIIIDEVGGLDWAREYLALAGHPDVKLSAAGADPTDAVRSASVDSRTYVFAAGEASRVALVRRLLRNDLSLDPTQFTASGYWRSGEAAFDHHQPLD